MAPDVIWEAGTKTRVGPMVKIGPGTWRGRVRTLKYAFKVGVGSTKQGGAALIYDKSGVHETASPDWFVQSEADYSVVKQPNWIQLGAVIYRIDTDRFGTNVLDDRGPQSTIKHLDYLTSLGANVLDLVGKGLGQAQNVVDEIHHRDWRAILPLGTDVRAADGWEVAGAAYSGDAWAFGYTAAEAHTAVRPGALSSIEDDRWRQAVFEFIHNKSVKPGDLEKTLSNFLQDYPGGTSNALILALDSPDGQRVAQTFPNLNQLRQAWIFQMSFPGLPLVQSGDENAQTDSDGPMRWELDARASTFQTFAKQIIAARLQRASLYRGSYQVVLADDERNLFGYVRRDRFETSFALFNNGDDVETVTLPAGLFGTGGVIDLVGGASFGVSNSTLKVTIGPGSAVLLGTPASN